MNILPTIGTITRGISDFEKRLQYLSTEDVKYLAEKVIDGSEAVGHLKLEYAEVFLQLLKERYLKMWRIG